MDFCTTDADARLFCDLGFGHESISSREWLELLVRGGASNIKLLATDIVPQRVRHARRLLEERPMDIDEKVAQIDFQVSGFNVPLLHGERVSVMRAMNVLRQYDESGVAAAHMTMAAALKDGGLLLEGTSNPLGKIWTANLLQRVNDRLEHRFLVLAAKFTQRNLSANLFKALLPRSFVNQTRQPLIASFFDTWDRLLVEVVRPMRISIRKQFVLLAEQLYKANFSVRLDNTLLKRGFLCWDIRADLTRAGFDADSVIYRGASEFDGKFTASLTGQ